MATRGIRATSVAMSLLHVVTTNIPDIQIFATQLVAKLFITEPSPQLLLQVPKLLLYTSLLIIKEDWQL